jgi:hypothetical protein
MHLNIHDDCCCLFCGEFKSPYSSRAFSRDAKLLKERVLVDTDNNAVNFVGKFLPFPFNIFVKIKNFIRAMTFEPFPPASFKIGNKKMVIADEKYFKGFE